jgi:hypothetical protein
MAARQSTPIIKITVRPGILCQPISFHVSVKGPASAGITQGTENLLSNGQLLQAIKLTSKGGRGPNTVGEGNNTFFPSLAVKSYIQAAIPLRLSL